MSLCIIQYTIRKDTSYNNIGNIGTPGSAGKLATAKTPSAAGTTATAETPATSGLKATVGKTTPGTPTKAGNSAACS
jgi:hypothetical protein